MEEVSTAAPELTARGRASRARIVQAATRLMLEQGVNATSVEDVLAAAGASKSQLYHYFNGKQQLVQAVIEAAAAAVFAAQLPFVDTLDSWEAIEGWCNHIISLKERNGCALGCPLGTLTSELAATDEAARALLADSYDRWESHLRTGLTAMRGQGLLEPSAEIDVLATATMASLQGGLLLAKATQSVRPLRIALDAAVAYLRTFQTPPQTGRPRSAIPNLSKENRRGRL